MFSPKLNIVMDLSVNIKSIVSKNKKIFLFIITVLLIYLSCGMPPRQDSQGPVEVTFWHAMAGQHLKVVNDIADEFEKLHPDIKITPVYQGSYDALHQKLVASLTSGTQPSMAQMYESWTTRFLERNLVEPVENFFHPKDGKDGFTKDDLNDIFPVFLSNSTWAGKVVTLPFNKSAYMLFYNKEMLLENGFESPPKDWDEFLEQAKKITVASEGKITRYGYATRPFIEGLTVFLFLNEQKYLSDDGSAFLMGEPGNVETFKFVVDLVQKYKVAYVESDYLTSAFGSKKIAMYIGSTASFPYNDKAVGNKFTWLAAPMPASPEKKGKALFQGTNIGIFSNIDSKEREAAWLFLKFLTNTKNATRWSIETGYLPIRRSCLEQPEMKAYLASNPNYKIVLTQIDRGMFEPRFVFWESIRDNITREFESALNGTKTVEEAIRTLDRKCNFILKTER